VEFADSYEQLLALTPQIDVDGRSFELTRSAGSARKRLGSYSTPPCLIEALLCSALDPFLEQALARPDPVAALLALRVCDPACGSGRFLIAAGRRIAQRLLEARRQKTAALAGAFSEVAGRCLFGVDRDPLAVDLCRLMLWRACEDRGLPPSAFDEHLRCGNSLIGSLAVREDADAWTAGCMRNTAIELLRRRHGFFHWRAEFADCADGFDLVLCNPPWERVKLQARAGLSEESGQAEEVSRFLRRCGRYPLSARGDLNYYGPFVELCRQLLRPGGRAGLIVPSGLATDDSMKELFAALMGDDLVSWFDFHNRGRLFAGVQGNMKFGLLTLARGPHTSFRTAGQLAHPAELKEPGRVCTLTLEQVARLNPNTRHCPTFAGIADAALVERIHARFPILLRDGSEAGNPWGVRLWTMFHMTKDAPLFRREATMRAAGCKLAGNVFRRGGESFLPLYEAKLIAPFSCRAATFAGVAEEVRFRTHPRTRPLRSAREAVLPRYWVAEKAVRARGGDARWFFGFRNAISAVADSRSLVAAIVPRAGIGNSLPLIAGPDARSSCVLLALLNSFVLDYVLRQKASGSNLNFHVLKQLPLPAPDSIPPALENRLVRTVLRLVYTTPELRAFARECGHREAPEQLDEEERFRLRCEIDAACFRLYGLVRGEVEHVLGRFPVLARRETRQHGRFRSSARILELLDKRTEKME
jgi:hypothetical protein